MYKSTLYGHVTVKCSLFWIFTARRVCIAQTMTWQDVCLSVRYAGILYKRLYISSKVFLPSGSSSTTILVFHTKRDGNIPTALTVTEAPNARGYEKITICDQYRALSRN